MAGFLTKEVMSSKEYKILWVLVFSRINEIIHGGWRTIPNMCRCPLPFAQLHYANKHPAKLYRSRIKLDELCAQSIYSYYLITLSIHPPAISPY